MEPDWSDFRVLLALANAGSVAGAARELQVDHSTVSRRLAALEAAAGARLLIRGGRAFGLTADGRSLLAAAQAMQAAVAQAMLSVRSARNGVEGSVRISVAPAFVPPLMRLLLPSLRTQYPALNVELVGAYGRADLARGEADIAVRMARPTEPELVGRIALHCGWFAFASQGYLAAHGRPDTPAQLNRHRLVLYVESMHDVAALRWMEPHRGGVQQISRVDNLEIARDMIAADGGIAVLPHFMAVAVPNLERALPDCVAVNVGWIVYHEMQRDSARVRAVVDGLVACFEANGAWFAGFEGPPPHIGTS